MHVAVKLLPHAEGLPLPAYQTTGAAGLDLLAAIANDAEITLESGARVLVPTGLVLDADEFQAALRRPWASDRRRSGFSWTSHNTEKANADA